MPLTQFAWAWVENANNSATLAGSHRQLGKACGVSVLRQAYLESMSIRQSRITGAFVLGTSILGLGCSGGTGSPIGNLPSATGGTGSGAPAGGSQNSTGGNAQSATGGAQNSNGGNTQSATGGAQNSNGGNTQSATGGARNTTGGVQNSSGGNTQSATGGVRNTTGGVQNSNGGNTQSATGGSSTTSGGTTATATGGQSSVTAACSAAAKGDVVTSVPSGTFQGSVSVSLTTTISNAEIRYTTDGQAPTATSTLYSGTALNFTATTRLRAQAFVQGAVSGMPTTAIYIARAIDGTHDLPVIVLDSYGSGKLPTDYTKDRPYVDVAFLGYDVSGGSVSISSTPSMASLAAFHVRGNSSSMADKVPYKLEFRNEAGGDRDCPLFGMPAESDWALVGPHADKTLIHNNYVYELGLAMGLKAPRIKLAEVYVNVDNQPLAADDYQGVYQVVETIKNQKDRLDLKQLDETKTSATEITGGYIFKFDWMLTADVSIPCPTSAANCWKYLELVDPVPVAQPQMDYLTQHLVSFNNALHTTNIADATTGYPSFVEVGTFVDHVIINEFTRNMDGFARSQYFFKDRGAKLNAGPLWDFDLIAGIGLKPGGFGGTMANTAADGWQYEGNKSRLAGATADWFPVLIADPTFKAQLITRWKSLRQGLLSNASIASRIDAASAGLSAAAGRNFTRWNILTQARVEPFDTTIDATWAGQISSMKTWLQARAAWLDTQWK